jgi:hypothetical protein
MIAHSSEDDQSSELLPDEEDQPNKSTLDESNHSTRALPNKENQSCDGFPDGEDLSNKQLPDEGNDSNLLPAERLCNRMGVGKENPIFGEGALGNESTDRMYYLGDDKKKLVMILQRMLKELGYELGDSGPDKNGVDGVFGKKTENAVLEFQKGHKDWEGNPLKKDGLVGPKTSDALNREIVGRWYRQYQMPEKLAQSKQHHTTTVDYLMKGLSVETKQANEAIIFLVGPFPKQDLKAMLTIRLIDVYRKALGDTEYSLEIDDPNFKRVNGVTDKNGILSHHVPVSAKSGKLILDTCIFNLSIKDLQPANTIMGAVIRLNNLGYEIKEADLLQKGAKQIGGEEQGSKELRRFQTEHNIGATGKLDGTTVRKLEEEYGS